MKILPRDDFQKWLYDRDVARGMSERDAAFDAITTSGIYTQPEDEIVVRGGVSTGKKLHELGHKKYQGKLREPNKPADWPEHTIGDMAYNEVMAEKYSWELRDKKLTYRVGIPAVFTLMYQAKESPKEAVKDVIEVLELDLGIEVPLSGKRELNRMASKFKRVV